MKAPHTLTDKETDKVVALALKNLLAEMPRLRRVAAKDLRRALSRLGPLYTKPGFTMAVTLTLTSPVTVKMDLGTFKILKRPTAK